MLETLMNIFSLGLASTRPRTSPGKFESHTSARKPRLDQVIPFQIGTESAKCGPVAIEVEALEKFSRIPGPRQSTSRQRIAFARAENDNIEEVFTCGNPSWQNVFADTTALSSTAFFAFSQLCRLCSKPATMLQPTHASCSPFALFDLDMRTYFKKCNEETCTRGKAAQTPQHSADTIRWLWRQRRTWEDRIGSLSWRSSFAAIAMTTGDSSKAALWICRKLILHSFDLAAFTNLHVVASSGVRRSR